MPEGDTGFDFSLVLRHQKLWLGQIENLSTSARSGACLAREYPQPE